MLNRILRGVKHRLSATIDRRINHELETERKAMLAVSESMNDISVTFADQITTLTKVVESLEERLTELEK